MIDWRKSLSHFGLAIPLLALGVLTGETVNMVCLTFGYWFGREIAQHEAKTTGPWHRGFHTWEWTEQTWFDLLGPVLACLIALAIEWGLS